MEVIKTWSRIAGVLHWKFEGAPLMEVIKTSLK